MTLTAVVTGGSGEIGRAIVERLAREGYRILVGYRSAHDEAVSIVNGLPGSGHEAWPISITDAESLVALARQVDTEFGHLDLLVNCAGVTRPVAHDDLISLDDDLIDEIFRVNWRGPFATIRALHPMLVASPAPLIVNISSVAAVTGQGSNVAYCASKAALDSMTRSLARSLAPEVRILSVSPGWVMGDYASRMPAEFIARQCDETPLARLALPEDVADAVVASVQLKFTTGTAIAVDGGRPLGAG